jgi:hypothetical protein
VASVQSLPGYTEVDRRATKVDDQDVTLHIFNAQPDDSQPESRFYQVSAVKEGLGYTFTAATPLASPDEVEAQVLTILRGATLINPEGEESSEEAAE